ncbi:hypothetical protein DRE_02675 [Drechslerella stenobrocha 248]|uniref:RRM domain-containing protein n=1 Tax=Drechslerella stenobrocha 248 TaxID=1043628 RepID=W7HV88_9PEZI|nr:hypothetical protein DRE_02675 [Drechslerella stenobrocha 248]
MNVIREVRALTRAEIDAGTPDSASWHRDYAHTAYIFIGNLPFELSEGDVIAIFSQYGEPVHLHLARDRDTGRSRGFGWLKYEDQRSTNLAVDNLTGAVILGRTIRVDHAEYKHKDGDGAEEAFQGLNIAGQKGSHHDNRDADADADASERRHSKRRRRDDSPDESAGVDPEEAAQRRREDAELQKLERDHDDDDPMKDYLIREKKKEIEDARAARDTTRPSRKRDGKSSDHRSRRHDRHHRSTKSRSRSRSRSADGRERGGDGPSRRSRDHEDEDRRRRHHRDRDRNRDDGGDSGRGRDRGGSRREHHDRDDSAEDTRQRRRADDRGKEDDKRRREGDHGREHRRRDEKDDHRDHRRRRSSRERS